MIVRMTRVLGSTGQKNRMKAEEGLNIYRGRTAGKEVGKPDWVTFRRVLCSEFPVWIM